MSEVQLGPDNTTGRGAGASQIAGLPARTAPKRRVLGFLRKQPHTVPDVAVPRHWRTALIERSAAPGERVTAWPGRNYDQIS